MASDTEVVSRESGLDEIERTSRAKENKVGSEISAGDLEEESHDASTPGELKKESQLAPAPAAAQSAPAPIHPSNGGLEAWLFVLAGFFIFVNSW